MTDPTPDQHSVLDALTAVRAALGPISKDESAPANQGGYKFVGIDKIVAVATPLMAQHGLNIVGCETIEYRRETYATKSGTHMERVWLHQAFRVYGPLGDWIPSSAWGEAADAGDKATPKAHTNARKNCIKDVLQVTDREDDTDRDAADKGRGQSSENGGTPDVPWVVQLGWARSDADDATLIAAVAAHDGAREGILARVKALEPEARILFKEKLDKNDLSLAGAISAAGAALMSSWLPTESPETPPAAQDGPAPAEAGQPLPGEYPDAPKGISHERWKGALAVVDSMRLSEILASLAEHGLGTKGTEAERRIRLAVAIASEAQPD